MAEHTGSLAEASASSYALVAIAALLMTMWFVCHQVQKMKYRHPPGPTGLPIFGSLFSLVFTNRQQYEVLNDWWKKFGDIFSFKILNVRICVLNSVEMSRDVMGSLHMMDRMPVSLLKTLTGRENVGIVFSNGKAWKEQRRFVLNVFRKADGDGTRFEGIVSAQAERMLAEMEKANARPFDPQPLLHMSTGNVITSIITGITYDFDDPNFQRVMTHSNRIFDLLGPAGILSAVPILAALPSSSQRLLLKEWGGVYDFIRESIENHKARLSLDQDDFIDSYLQEMKGRTTENVHNSFDEINLVASCFDLLLGGWETSATTISWSLHTLSFHPEAQHRVRQEIFDVVGQGRPPRYSDRHDMPITLATIAECIRFRPSFDLHIPHVATQDCKVGEYDIPRGTVVTTNLGHLFHSSRIWENPMSFLPDRFLNEDGSFDRTREPMLFGTGRRVCPGEQLARTEIFLFITYILQRFTLSPAEGVPRDLPSRHRLTNLPDPFKIHVVKIT